MTGTGKLYGVMGRFSDRERLLDAVRACRRDYPDLEVYSPFPVQGMPEALGLGPDRVSHWALAGGVFGASCGFAIQWYSAVIAYPIDVGGRPAFSWPAFLPITLLLTLFWGAFAAAAAMFLLNRLPRLHHPVFNVSDFSAASREGLFLVICANGFDLDATRARARLEALGAAPVWEVPV